VPMDDLEKAEVAELADLARAGMCLRTCQAGL